MVLWLWYDIPGLLIYNRVPVANMFWMHWRIIISTFLIHSYPNQATISDLSLNGNSVAYEVGFTVGALVVTNRSPEWLMCKGLIWYDFSEFTTKRRISIENQFFLMRYGLCSSYHGENYLASTTVFSKSNIWYIYFYLAIWTAAKIYSVIFNFLITKLITFSKVYGLKVSINHEKKNSSKYTPVAIVNIS